MPVHFGFDDHTQLCFWCIVYTSVQFCI